MRNGFSLKGVLGSGCRQTKNSRDGEIRHKVLQKSTFKVINIFGSIFTKQNDKHTVHLINLFINIYYELKKNFNTKNNQASSANAFIKVLKHTSTILKKSFK